MSEPSLTLKVQTWEEKGMMEDGDERHTFGSTLVGKPLACSAAEPVQWRSKRVRIQIEGLLRLDVELARAMVDNGHWSLSKIDDLTRTRVD